MRVGRETVQRLGAAGDTFALQVRHPSDLGAAIGALKLARVDVLGLAARTRANHDAASGAWPADGSDGIHHPHPHPAVV